MHVFKFNDRRIKDILKLFCHGLQFGGRGNKFTTGPLMFLWIHFCYSELSIMNAAHNDTSYDVTT